MANIFTHFQASLINNPELAETSKPQTRKSLERTEKETRDYEKWKNTPTVAKMLFYLSEECQKHQTNPRKTHDGIDFYNAPSARGFRMHPALTRFSDSNVKLFFDFLKERLIALDYRAVSSDTLVFKRGDYWVETIHKHVLKAPNTNGGYAENLVGDFDQITIELLLKDDKLCSLRLEATIPDSDLPRPTDDFAKLIQLLPA
jgi:hypothetical protein